MGMAKYKTGLVVYATGYGLLCLGGLAYHAAREEMSTRGSVAIILVQATEEGRPDCGDISVGGLRTLDRELRTLRLAGIDSCTVLFEGSSPSIEFDTSVFFAERRPSDALRARLADASAGRTVVVLRGDLPLLTAPTVSFLIEQHESAPSSVLLDVTGSLCITSGSGSWIDALLSTGDCGTMAADMGPEEVLRVAVAHEEDVMRFDDPARLGDIARVVRERTSARLASEGVFLVDPERITVDDLVSVGAGTTLLSGVHLLGATRIHPGCTIGPDCLIADSTVEQGCTVYYSVLESAHVRERTRIGPFTHLRPGADVGPEARLGNFVEVKAARLERGVKAGHLAYIGDAQIGPDVNVGAGTITCNYDGKTKAQTIIEEGAFIGSNTALVAPVRIGQGAFVAAGSTITEDVPPNARAFGRARQVVKPKKENEEDAG